MLNGYVVLVVVILFDESEVILDVNYFLVGKDLMFDFELVEIVVV